MFSMVDSDTAKHRERFGELNKKIIHKVGLTSEEAVQHKELFAKFGETRDAIGAIWVCSETGLPIPKGVSCPAGAPGCTCFQVTPP
jgi:hypothetical protein